MLNENEKPVWPEATIFPGSRVMREEFVSRVKLVQRRIRWLEKQVAFESALGPQRAQLMVDAGADLAAFEAELRAAGQWDYQGPTARYAEHNLCKEMIVLARKVANSEHMAALSQALTIARDELAAQVKEARRVGGQRWNIEKEALEGA